MWTCYVSRGDSPIRRMMQTLTERYPVNALCKYLQVSPAPLTRMLQHNHGESPAAYYQRLKMTRAQELLAGVSLSVKEIAYSLGYRHPNDFNRAFKQFTGRNPTGQQHE